MAKIQIGDKFGRLTVTSEEFRDKNQILVTASCECGSESTKTYRTYSLIKGYIKSCGCLRKEICSIVHYKNGLTKSPVRSIYSNMKSRCQNQKVKSYKDYGARGIKVCDEWNNNFESFHNWTIASGYQPGLELDRRNNDGNYEPSNCRWVTMLQNSRNKRNSNLNDIVVAEIKSMLLLGEHTVSEISRKFKVKRDTIYRMKSEQ